MGTRGAVGFRHKEKDHVTYNHFDSYPNGVGAQVLKQLSRFNLKNADELNLIRNKISEIKLINDEHLFDEKEQDIILLEIEALGFVHNDHDPEHFGNGKVDAYFLLNPLQGSIISYIDKNHSIPYMIESSDFLTDSLFCEWAYIINLDENVIEFYRGFNQDPASKGRYVFHDIDPNAEKDDYLGVALLGTISFNTLATWSDADIDLFCEKLQSYPYALNTEKYGEEYAMPAESLRKVSQDLSTLKDVPVSINE